MLEFGRAESAGGDWLPCLSASNDLGTPPCLTTMPALATG